MSESGIVTHGLAYLETKAGTADVSPYVVPARATHLSNLPMAYIDVGSGESFQDEDIAYATGFAIRQRTVARRH
ncbi:Carboxylesterase NlhH [Penicillium hordei]|uniref:Carboxylesterase NlhH n=1 Tax=Penicillium hordei TaxID=40994 RepID=A0AAD6DUW9_9EURO|nr:Carboxylesterase NlhH [Penicillium hordei]KAJ5593275.1 Carboxylesterase NlhH [Penicillium hordei]